MHHPDTTGERHPASPNLQSGSPQGHHSDPAIWRYFDAHWRQFFPTLPTRSVFAKHGANLSMLKRMVQRVLYPAAALKDPLILYGGKGFGDYARLL
ncbi:MAG: hypothetical protein ACJ8FD_04035 [Bradyrhizobium canariense]